MDVREFIRARLDEDEAAARRLGAHIHWREEGDTGVIVASDGHTAEACANGNWTGVAEHITRFDPARVLAEVTFKRAVVDRHMPERAGYFDPKTKTGMTFVACEVEGNGGTTDDAWPCAELDALAALWSDHPDFGEITRLSAEKRDTEA